ncbi:hypothetical protein HP439_05240 [Sphingobacterium shayense]|uniref:hypothetical protein n=1 Tax=Sphingobacterium shayense TaxID=626343 RepID=UPI00155364BE|nr:hypothetical protein [Sphingobacterium shayense]NQD70121.1 hypothetical protein [Sphingobacterium shayense]
MERFLFESLITNEERIQQLERCLDRMQAIQNWEIKRLQNGIIITIEALRIRAFELGLALTKNGYSVERVYEE